MTLNYGYQISRNGFSELRGPQGPPGPKGDHGSSSNVGQTGPRGPQGTNGHDGIRGQIGPQGQQGLSGAQGPRGLRGFAGTSSALNLAGFTMQGNITMANNRILSLPDPILDNEPTTFKYTQANYLDKFSDNHIGLNKIETYLDQDDSVSDTSLIARRYADKRYARKINLPVAEWTWGYTNTTSVFKYPDALGGTWAPAGVRTDDITTKTTLKLKHITFDNELIKSQILTSTVAVKLLAYTSATTSEEHLLFTIPMTSRTLIPSKNSTSAGDRDNHTVVLNDSYFLGTLLGSKNVKAFTILIKLSGYVSINKPEILAAFRLYEGN